MAAHPSRITPLLAGVLGGIIGLGLDLDHLVACLFVGQFPSPGSWSCGFGRPLHWPAFLVVIAFLGYRITHTYRLLVKKEIIIK
jgi:hypothetical protein